MTFPDQADTLDLDGVALKSQVGFILSDPPYNIPQQLSRPYSNHDFLTMGDITPLAELFGDYMRLGTNGYISFALKVSFKIGLIIWMV